MLLRVGFVLTAPLASDGLSVSTWQVTKVAVTVEAVAGMLRTSGFDEPLAAPLQLTKPAAGVSVMDAPLTK